MVVNYDRDEFRKYLQDSGAVEAVSRVFLKLYELKGNRPKSSVKFIQDRITDAVPSLTEYEKLIEDLKAMGTMLLELKAAGKLDTAQSEAIDKIGTIANIPGACNDTSKVTSKAQPRISARHSQIGNELKGGATVSNIRNDKSNEKKIQDAIAALLQNTQSHSLLKTHIKNLYDQYKTKLAANNTSFVDCICSGLDIPESTIGVYATDVEAYKEYSQLFNPIITEYHGFNVAGNTNHPALEWGNPKDFSEIDPTNTYIRWTRIRCVRNVNQHPLVPKMNEDQLKQLCKDIKKVFTNKLTTDDVKGDFYKLDELKNNPDKEKELTDKNYILKNGDKFLQSVGATEFWPNGRAVYINKNETFFVWINEEDHLRFISMESGSNIGNVYGRLVQALQDVVKAPNELQFQHDSKLGFVSLCPSNLGNTIRASVMITLPKLTGGRRNELEALIKTHNFEIRSASSSNETIEISNKTKLGITEYDSVKNFCDGIQKIIKAEEQ